MLFSPNFTSVSMEPERGDAISMIERVLFSSDDGYLVACHARGILKKRVSKSW